MTEIVWSITAYVVAVGILVTFHEFGHFWVARRCGVKVLRFSVGFGRALWSRRGRDGVEYVLAAIPLGGYVKMLDEREGEVPPELAARAFNRQSLWKRSVIVIAGPAFNFLLAVAAYWAMYVIGLPDIKPLIAAPPSQSAAAKAGLRDGDRVLSVDGRSVANWSQLRTDLVAHSLDGGSIELRVAGVQGPARRVVLPLSGVRVEPEHLFDDLGLMPYQPPLPPLLSEIVASSPAAAAGFRKGDRLLTYDGHPIVSWQNFAAYVHAHPDRSLAVTVARDGRRLQLDLRLGHQSDDRSTGFFGAAVAADPRLWQSLRADQRLGPVPAVPAALAQTWRMSALTLKLVGRIFTGGLSLSNLGGPIRTAEAAGFSAQMGVAAFLSFLAFVSVNLGLINLFPVPVLDGGHLLFYGVEAVRGSPLSERAQALGQQVGFTLLVLLIGIVFYNDIASLVG
ncbi:MAG: RIP metalloprotease RseP [Gammaproteobacteria bacterium]|nr:RIP metalloprotease RseP [Gammaproteobacteria bacterium]